MTLSNGAEFIPWIIQTNSEKIFSKRNVAEIENLGKIENIEKHVKWTPAYLPEEANKEIPEKEKDELIASIEVDEADEVDEAVEVDEVGVEEVIDPELTPTYTPVEYRENAEAEYLRGYNSCKENEKLEFSDRLEQLNVLIDTLKKEYVDLSEFYDPIRELVANAIETIMQVELSESKNSISNIVSAILEEMSIEAGGEIRIFLNPNDAVLLKNRKSDSEYPVKILSDHRLTRGSARAVMGDSIIESMKENRVADIVNQILGEKNKKATKSVRKKTTSSSRIKSAKK
jgi:hypothetical protein